MKKHLILLLVLFLMMSSSFVGVSTQMNTDTDTSEMSNDKDISNVRTLQYATDWSMHRTNQTPSKETCGSFYNNIESRDPEPVLLSGPMDSPWPMISHDIKHTGRSSFSTANNSGAETWRYAVYEDGDIYNTPLLGENNTIYLGSVHVFYLFALNTNGTEKWRCRLGYDRIWATPAISPDGTVVFPTWGGYGTFYAINPNGTVKWTFKDSDSEGISSPAIAYDGTIVYGGEGYPGYPIYALYPNGTLRWRYNTGYYVIAAPAIDQEGTIYIGSGDTYFYALNLNGTLRWRFKTGDYIKGAASIATDGTIYVPSFDGYLYALYPNGTMRWRASTGDSMNAAGVAIGKLGTIYVGTEMLRAFNPNGTLKWITDVQGDIYGSVPSVSADGTIYVTAGNSLVAVNPDGTVRWRRQITNDVIIRSSPSIGPKDWIYVGSGELESDGYLHAFGTMENNQPPEKPIIDGPSQVKIKTDVTFTFQANDPDLNPISFFISWGDGTNNQTIDYMSGMAVSFTHRWTTKGTYTIQAKAIDTFGLESGWATFVVKAPMSSEPPHFPFIEWLLERFPNVFPLLRYLFGFNQYL